MQIHQDFNVAADATYKVDDNIDITVTWDEAVAVTDTPTLTLSNGATATYQSGTGNAALVFRYTVVEDQTNSADLSVSSYSGTIKDAAGNTAEAASGDLGAVIVDANSPGFQSVAATDGTYKVGDDIAITVTYGEAVIGTGSALTLSNGATAVYTSGSGSTAMVYTYTVEEGNTASADLSVSSYSGTIKDAAGNTAEAASGDLGAVIVDANSPTVTGVSSTSSNGFYINGNSLSIQIILSEAVNVTGIPQLTLNTGETATAVNYSSGTSTNTLNFVYTVGPSHNNCDLDLLEPGSLALNGGTIKDVAGNDAILTLPEPGALNSLAE